MVGLLLTFIVPEAVFDDKVRVKNAFDPVQGEVDRLTNTPGALAELRIEVWVGPKFEL